jgi:hypothetical protein
MAFIGNGTIGNVYALATTNITGSEFLTVLGLFIVFIFFGLSAKLDLMPILIVVSPMLLVFLAFNGEFIFLTVAIILYLAIVLANYYFG